MGMIIIGFSFGLKKIIIFDENSGIRRVVRIGGGGAVE